jgi:hypothetical protein
MKRLAFRWFSLALLIGVLALIVTARAGAVTGSWQIGWWTIDSGGGVAAGDAYSVAGTIGQFDAGPHLSGGDYGIQGGFWDTVVVEPLPDPTPTPPPDDGHRLFLPAMLK